MVAGVGKGIMGAAMNYARGDVMGMAKGLFSTFTTAKNTNSAEDYTRANRSSGADVVMMSGCKDSQTSADATEAGKATGAMSWAFMTVSTSVGAVLAGRSPRRLQPRAARSLCLPVPSQVMSEHPQLSYQQLLCETRDLLAAKYSQKPQCVTRHDMEEGGRSEES